MTLYEYFGLVDHDLAEPSSVEKLASLKLEDIMVPLAKTLEKAQKFETNDTLMYQIRHQSPDTTTEDQELYSVDYSYAEPILPEWSKLSKEDVVKLPREILDRWVATVNHRVHPIINTAVPLDKIREFDKHDDWGLILSAYDGQWGPFEYSKIKSFDLLILPEVLPELFQSVDPKFRKSIWGDVREAKKLTGDVLGDVDEYRFFYQLTYQTEEGDLFRPGVRADYGCMNPVPLSYLQTMTWLSYACLMFEHHAKVIYLP